MDSARTDACAHCCYPSHFSAQRCARWRTLANRLLDVTEFIFQHNAAAPPKHKCYLYSSRLIKRFIIDLSIANFRIININGRGEARD